MTKAAHHFGKRIDNFMRLESTQDYIDALQALTSEVLVQSQHGGRPGKAGTWGHPKLAVFFARWLDVKFAVWCNSVIEDILKGAAKVDIVKPQQSAVIKTTEALGTCSQSLTSTSIPPPFAW